MQAVTMTGTGGREMLEYLERPDPTPGPGEALVEIAYAGINFMDIGIRQGMAWTEIPNPKILGVEGAGRVLRWARASKASQAASASPGCTRQEAMRSGSRFRPPRWCRSPTRSTTAWRPR